MRKIITLSAVAVMAVTLFSSCKKDYTCTCTFNGQEVKTTIPDSRKPEAKLTCDAMKMAGGDCKLD